MDVHRHHRHQHGRQSLRLTGGRFVYTSTTVVTLTRFTGQDLLVGVSDGATRHYQLAIGADLTCALTVSGPGGLHPGHAEQASTIYTVYLAWRSSSHQDTGSTALFCVPSGTVVDAAKVASLDLVSPYDFWSQPIGYFRNDAGSNIESFLNQGGRFWPDGQHEGLTIASALLSTAGASVDVRPFIPQESSQYYLSVQPFNTAAALYYCQIAFKESHTGVLDDTLLAYAGAVLGGSSKQTQFAEASTAGNDDFAAKIWYRWSFAPTTGLRLGLLYVDLY